MDADNERMNLIFVFFYLWWRANYNPLVSFLLFIKFVISYRTNTKYFIAFKTVINLQFQHNFNFLENKVNLCKPITLGLRFKFNS